MTPQPKSRTIGCWLVLDDKGDTWRVQCVCCQHTRTLARNLLRGAVVPRCPRCGNSAGPTYVTTLPPEVEARSCTTWGTDSCVPAVVPVQVVAPVTAPMPDALFGIFGMVPVKADKPKQPKEPKPPKPRRQIHRTTVPLGPVAGTRLTVLGESETSGGRAMMRCRCECGVVKDVLRWHLSKGNIQSCGCAKDSPAQTGHNMRTVALPGDVFGSLVVVEEAPKQGKNRTVLAECRHCSMRWRVAIQNLRRTTDACACQMRWAVSAAGIEEAHRIREAQKAKRLDYDRLRKCREVERQIHAAEVRLAVLRAKLESLQSPPTVAQ